jgi:hypothetical protein
MPPPSPDRSRHFPSGLIYPQRATGRAWPVCIPPRTAAATRLRPASKQNSPRFTAAEFTANVGRTAHRVRTPPLRPAAATRATIRGQNPMQREAPRARRAPRPRRKPRSAARTSCTPHRFLRPAFARACAAGGAKQPVARRTPAPRHGWRANSGRIPCPAVRRGTPASRGECRQEIATTDEHR